MPRKASNTSKQASKTPATASPNRTSGKEEPVLTVFTPDGCVETWDLLTALAWYRDNVSLEDFRGYLTEYLESQGKTELIPVVKKVPDSFFPRSAAASARLLTRGYKLHQGDLDYLNAEIERVVKQKEV
jgi:hypothetical protein